jgi:poly(3-hydroxybutyrate) depolymerase
VVLDDEDRGVGAHAIQSFERAEFTPSVPGSIPATDHLARRSIVAAGVERTYWLAGDPDQGAPVLIALHGLGMTATQMAEWTGLATRGPTAGFTTVFPEAVPGGDRPVERMTWQASAGPAVILYRIEGGGHGWPGGPQYLPARLVGQIPRRLDATGILLRFVEDAATPDDSRPPPPARHPRS